jgi:hypothetical protein
MTAFSVDGGEQLATPEETDEAIERARRAVGTDSDAEPNEHTHAAGVLAEAVDKLLDWPKQPPAERRDFTAVLYAVEMARYQYGGESEYLDSSPFRGRS